MKIKHQEPITLLIMAKKIVKVFVSEKSNNP